MAQPNSAAAGLLGAEGAAVGAADVDGAAADVDGLAVVDVDGLPVVGVAGDWGPWKSVHVSVRKVLPLDVTLKAVGVTV